MVLLLGQVASLFVYGAQKGSVAVVRKDCFQMLGGGVFAALLFGRKHSK